MVLCKGCGLDIDEAMLFCPNCGRKREMVAAAPDKQGPLRVIPCRVGGNDHWTPAAAILATDSISLYFLSERTSRPSPLTIFLPPTGYLPSTLEVSRVEEAAKTPDLVVLVDDIRRADLSYVQMEGEELYSLKIQLDPEVIGLRLPMDKAYRDLLMKMLGQRLRW